MTMANWLFSSAF